MAAHDVTPVAGLSATMANQANRMVGEAGEFNTAPTSIGDDRKYETDTQLRAATKRAVDLVLGVAIAVALAPVMLAIAILLACTSRGSVLVREARVGRGGVPFAWVGFRTVAPDSDRRSGVGALLYRARLDELPQIFNVLQGQMSIVGPRAEPVARVRELSAVLRGYSQRHLVKPGLTGWSQTMAHWSSGDEARRLAYDLHYVRHHNLLADCRVLLRTLALVVMGGAGR